MKTTKLTFSTCTPEEKIRFSASNNISYNLCVLQDYLKHSISSLSTENLSDLAKDFDDIVYSFINLRINENKDPITTKESH